MSTQFQNIYSILNPAQKKAVDTIDGPVMVLAGPGTGKTQVLAARIANILLKTDTKPHSILALTFTESAAKNMRERLVKMIGKTGYYVQIHTFHSFCSEVIRTYPEFFPIERGSEPLSELERFEIFQSILGDLELEFIKPLNTPLLYLKDIIFAISNLKREGVTINKFAEILHNQRHEIDALKIENEGLRGKKRTISQAELTKLDKHNNKNQELLKIYEEYEKRLRSGMRYDFDDMIALVVEAFQKEEALLQEYQENLQYFLVDEYQDTNSSQNKVVDLLASYWGDQANIFTVGDPNQAIYRFQGASVENVLGFAKKYQGAEIINLDVGYRCSQNVYDLATKLIKENHLQGFSENQSLKSIHGVGEKIGIYVAPSQILEAVFVVEEIQKLIANGVDPGEIAILYRHNADEKLFAEVLEKWGLRYEVDGGGDVLDQEYIQHLINFFRVLIDIRTSTENELLFEIMLYPWFNLDQTLIMKVARASGKAKMSIFDLISKGHEEFQKYHFGVEVSQEDFSILSDFLQKLISWSNQDLSMTFNAWFEMIIKETGFLDWLMNHEDKIEMLNTLNSLYEEIKALISREHNFRLANFVEAIEIIQNQNLKISIEDLNVKEKAVRLSTVHRAKGQEWEHVFLVHCLDKKWGNNSHRDLIKLPDEILENTDLSLKERNEDERRLFYVGLTRAKKTVKVTYSQTQVSENKTKDVVPSIFVEELREFLDHIDFLQNEEINANAENYLLKLLQPPAIRPISISEREFFSEIVKDYKLSVTGLNKYLKDVEDFKINVLLKAPKAKPIPMIFGSAVHYALEKMYKVVQIMGKPAGLKNFLDDFELALKREPLTQEEFKKRLEYGKEILTSYYEHNASMVTNPLHIEFNIGSGAHQVMMDDVFLTGKIDRIDWLDKEKKTVRVIDYKTGKHKSLNEIEGRTESAGLSPRELALPEEIRGPYKRQLLFYKLLADLDRNFIPEVTEGVFDFIQPDDKSGRFVTRSFTLKKKDVDLLKALIKEVMQEIRELRFL